MGAPIISALWCAPYSFTMPQSTRNGSAHASVGITSILNLVFELRILFVILHAIDSEREHGHRRQKEPGLGTTNEELSRVMFGC